MNFGHCRGLLKIIFLVSATLIPSNGFAMGDPLVNLSVFFEHIARVQFDSPEDINNMRVFNIDEDYVYREREFALKHIATAKSHSDPLECTDLELQDYDDWLEQEKVAKEARKIWRSKEHQNNVRPPKEAYLDNYPLWNSPVFAKLHKRKSTFLGNFQRTRVSIAVLGENFDVSSLWDEQSEVFTSSSVEKVKRIRGFNHDGLFDRQLFNRSVTLLSSETCSGGFTIFDFEIK